MWSGRALAAPPIPFVLSPPVRPPQRQKPAVLPNAAAPASSAARDTTVDSGRSASNQTGSRERAQGAATQPAQFRHYLEQPARPTKEQQQQQAQHSVLQPPSAPPSRFCNSRTADQLLGQVDCPPSLTPASAADILSSLARLLRRADPGDRQYVRQHPMLPRLLAALQEGAAELPLRNLVGVLQQCVWLQLRPPRALLCTATEQLVHRLPAAAPTDACHAAWALTRLGHDGISSLLAAIDVLVRAQMGLRRDQQQQHLGQEQQQQRQQRQQPGAAGAELPPPWLAVLPPASLVNLLWACGKASFRSQPLQEAIAGTLLSSSVRSSRRADRTVQSAASTAASAAPLASLTPQQLSMLFYSLGQLQWAPGQQFLHHAAAAAQQQLPSFTPQGLSNTGWAISRLGPAAQVQLEELAAALAAAAAPRLTEFSCQELVMIVVAAASPGPGWRQGRQRLMESAAEQVAERAPQMNDRDLVSLLSAFATVRFEPPARVLDAAASRITQLLPAVPPVSLSWLLWSLARMPHYRAPRLLLRKAEAALRGQLVELYELDAADLARLCWGLSEVHHYSGALLADLASVSRSMWQRMEPQSMAMVLHSFAQQQFTPHELLDAAAEHLAANLQRYSPQAVAVVAWSFGRLGVHPGRGLPAGGACTPDGTPLMAAIASYARENVDAFSLQGLSMLLWAFATLEHHPGTPLLQAVSARFVTALRGCQQPTDDGAGKAAFGLAAAGEAAKEAARAASEAAGTVAALSPAAQMVGNHRNSTHDGDPWMLKAAANTAWSLSKFGFADEPFFWAAVDALPALLPAQVLSSPAFQHTQLEEQEKQPHSAWAVEAQSISSLAFGAAKLRVEAAVPLLQQLLPAAQMRVGDFNLEELCQLLYSLAHARVQPPLALLDAAAARLAGLLARGGDSSGGPDEACLLCMAVHALANLSYRAEPGLLDACVQRAATFAPEVTVSLLAKLVWGCAHVGHEPDPKALKAIDASLYHRLSHSRGNHTVLNTPDLIHLLWGLAALRQYDSQLYRCLSFRAARLPDGVPVQPQLRRLLREATVLHSCEHRLDPVATNAATAILPAWMASQQQGMKRMAEESDIGELAAAAPWPKLVSRVVAGVDAEKGDVEAPIPRQAELRAAAEAVCSTLQRGGLSASLKQLSLGDFIVVFDLGSTSEAIDSSGSASRRMVGQAAVIPATTAGRASVNEALHQPVLLGSALVAHRVVAARGMPALPGTADEAELLTRCRSLLSQHT